MRIKLPGIVLVLFLLVLSLFSFTQLALAEQMGSSPESGVSSRIKTIYDSLTSSSFGSTSAGAWGDWGSMWNKIYSASIWSPDGNNTVTNTLSTKTFYNTSRTKQTGQAVVAATPSPATPAIGDASRLNILYKAVATTSYGAESAGAWGDWGSMFNRIYSSSTWTPSDANAAIADVVTGQTFYSGNNRTIKTGTSLSNGSVCVNSSDCFTGTCTTFYQDSDSDTYGNASVTTKRCGATYTGYVTNSTDCDDVNASIFRSVNGYLDADGDTYGTGALTTCAGATGAYVANNTDCGPNTATAYPGSATCSTGTFLNASGAASYDWNCGAGGGAGAACGTSYVYGAYAVYGTSYGGESCGNCNCGPWYNCGPRGKSCRDCKTCCSITCTGSSAGIYPYTGGTACGATGYTCNGSTNLPWSCNGVGTNYSVQCTSGTAYTQTCN